MRQLIYLSTAKIEFDATALDAILTISRTRNSAAGICGLLAYGQGVFFQVLEGERDTIDATLRRIERDPRHHSIRLLADHEVAGRDFAGWSMAYTPLGPENAQRAKEGRLLAKDIPNIVAGLNSPLIATFLKRFASAA